MEETRRFSTRNSIKMLNFIKENMMYDESNLKTEQEQNPVPVDSEWDAIIHEVQNNEEILRDLVKHIEETQTLSLEEVPTEKTAEIIMNPEETLSIIQKEVIIEKQEILKVMEVREKQKTVKKRLFGFFRRSSYRKKSDVG